VVKHTTVVAILGALLTVSCVEKLPVCGGGYNLPPDVADSCSQGPSDTWDEEIGMPDAELGGTVPDEIRPDEVWPDEAWVLDLLKDGRLSDGPKKETVCVPECEGKECGDDGCDGSCGLCLAGYECIDHKCVEISDPCNPNPCINPPPPECEGITTKVEFPAEGICVDEGGEAVCDYYPILVDCTTLVANGMCIGGECVPMGICGNGVCEEDEICAGCEDCPDPCEGKECGINECNEFCGECPKEHECQDGKCVPFGQGNTPSGPGQLLFTEIMADSAPQMGGDKGEWFELNNNTPEYYDLDGCVVSGNNGQQHTITGTFIVIPYQHVVLAVSENTDENYGLKPDYVYVGLEFEGGGDELILQCDGIEIDFFAYNGPLTEPGAAAQLSKGAYDAGLNDDPANWCPAMQEYGTDDKLGTPGASNDVCP